MDWIKICLCSKCRFLKFTVVQLSTHAVSGVKHYSNESSQRSSSTSYPSESVCLCVVLVSEWLFFCADVAIFIPWIYFRQAISTAVHRLTAALNLALICSFLFHWSGTVSDCELPQAFLCHLMFIWHLKRKNILSTLWKKKMEIVKDFLLICTLLDDLHLQEEALLLLCFVVVAAPSDSSQSWCDFQALWSQLSIALGGKVSRSIWFQCCMFTMDSDLTIEYAFYSFPVFLL